jgi:hypothetical protein
MKIYDYLDDEGRIMSFEIDNIGRSRALRFIESAFPSAIVKRQRSDDFGEVDLNGRKFIVSEPWGDSSRYMIHEQPLGPSAELDALRSALEKYRPSWLFSSDRWFTRVIVLIAVVLVAIVLSVAILS